THYGNIVRVNITSNTTPIVFTRSAEMTGTRQARVAIDVTQSGQSQVFERGVVFSDSVQVPQVNQSNVSSRAIQGGLGTVDITIENLQPNTRYFVRAFARNNQGISYGQVIELFTVGANAVQTRPATSITETGFTANGTVTNAIDASLIRESGFVFSTTNNTPTLSDQRVSFSNNRIGDFYMNIPNLARDTRYFVRAYTIVSSTTGTNAPTHTIFGEVIEVTTSPVEIEVTVNFLTTGAQANVGTQRITVAQGAELRAAQLQVPAGFSLFQPQWSIIVSDQMTNVSVLVQPDVVPETAFVPGTGNFTFSPNRAATRAEVAQILYNLSTTPSTGTPINFTDVPGNHPNRRAIDYVSSRLIMRGDAGAYTFRPNDPITRAEITVVLMNFYGLSGAANSSFPDVAPTAWYFLPVSLAFTHNMVAGYEDGTFGPARNITRAEVTTIFVRGEQRSQQPLSNLQFTDVPTTHWAHRFIMNASVPQN
ncbi:MAG: S-layer homology domain-containing protein, partial [Defluviitaleaceae bacterium]|nr:S-layer homology domain-containing protein [Defluviitaleaceae bacterium]